MLIINLLSKIGIPSSIPYTKLIPKHILGIRMWIQFKDENGITHHVPVNDMHINYSGITNEPIGITFEVKVKKSEKIKVTKKEREDYERLVGGYWVIQ